MPHRVATFFRSHANSFDLPTDLKKGPRRSSSNRPHPDRAPSSSGSSLVSLEDKSAKMPDAHNKRLSLSMSGLHVSPKSSSKSLSLAAGSLKFRIESPPILFIGTTTNSTGALLSGQLVLKVDEEFMAIESFQMKLACEVTRKRPFHSHCPECSNESTVLQKWNFLQGPATLSKGEHTFPFSFLFPGHLPASMKGSLSTIEYVLRATLTPKTGDALKASHVLDVKRALHPGDTDRHSVRIFPPTNLTANCQLPPVIHPIGEGKISLRMDGIVNRRADTKTQSQWKLKRLNWRLEETQKTISPACAKHAAKLGNVEEGKKGVVHQDVRVLGDAELKSGWKGDYTGPDGCIEMEFDFGIQPNSHPICDLKAQDGTEVSHVLIVEMIVTEEFAPINKPKQATPTGTARVLRMHFNVIVTERAGLGISWDEEQPPLYENVPISPPGYIYDVAPPIPEYADLTPLDNGVGSSSSSSITPNAHGDSR